MAYMGKRNAGLHKNQPNPDCILKLTGLEKDAGLTESRQLSRNFSVILQAARCISRREPEAGDFPPVPAEMEVGALWTGRGTCGEETLE